MLAGGATGLLIGIAATVLIDSPMRGDAVIALVVGVPAALGLPLVFASRRRAVTALGAFILAVGPGWFGALAVVEVVTGA